jgi:hypothetical protein
MTEASSPARRKTDVLLFRSSQVLCGLKRPAQSAWKLGSSAVRLYSRNDFFQTNKIFSAVEHQRRKIEGRDVGYAYFVLAQAVASQSLKEQYWRREWDSNPRYGFP